MTAASEILYHYKINRKQRALIYIRIGAACLLYIAGLFGYEALSGQIVPENLRSIYLLSFSVAAVIMFYIAWWHR